MSGPDRASRPPLPEGFAALIGRILPAEERSALLEALEGTALRGIRLVKLDPTGVEDALPGLLLDPVPWALGEGHYASEQVKPGRHPLHAGGAYYLQEPSAMAAVAALDVRPGQRVLDLCAAPGGKSGQIAARLQGSGVLVANEPVPGRARVLGYNLERLGVRNACVLQEQPERLAERFPGCFDRILVDAPCSGEGMFRREPAARVEWSPQHVQGCALRQRDILDHAARMLRPGGLLVYSTCTFNDTENEGTVAAFLEKHPDFAPEDTLLPGLGPSVSGCFRLFPHRVRGEGHFVARLRRDREAPPAPWPRPRHSQAVPDVSACRDFLSEAAPGFAVSGRFAAFGRNLCLLPEDAPPIEGLRALRYGLELGQTRPRHFQPAHALALALRPEQARRVQRLEEAEAHAWLAGQALASRVEPGWTLAVHRGVPLGFGKSVQQLLKNHMPYKVAERNDPE